MKLGISCYPTYGGSGIVASELALSLWERGHEVHVISYGTPPRLAELAPAPMNGNRLFLHEVVVRQYPLFDYPPYSLALATKMVEVVKRHDLELIHVHYAVPNAVSAILARQILDPRPLKVVTTLHGTDITLVGDDPSYVETTRFGIAQSDAVTAVSNSLRHDTVQRLGVDRPIEVIPNFIEPARVEAAEERSSRQRSGDEYTLVHVSNFRPVKRVLDTVEIFRRVRERVPTARLQMIGDGPDRARAQSRCSELGLDRFVSFLGNVPRIEQALVGCDVLLLPSESESFGLVALEALACGVPVVATEVGGLPEVVVDGEMGFLHGVGDVAAMEESVVKLLSDDDLRDAFAANGRAWATDRFARSEIVGRYVQLYERVLEGATPGVTAVG